MPYKLQCSIFFGAIWLCILLAVVIIGVVSEYVRCRKAEKEYCIYLKKKNEEYRRKMQFYRNEKEIKNI